MLSVMLFPEVHTGYVNYVNENNDIVMTLKLLISVGKYMHLISDYIGRDAIPFKRRKNRLTLRNIWTDQSTLG